MDFRALISKLICPIFGHFPDEAVSIHPKDPSKGYPVLCSLCLKVIQPGKYRKRKAGGISFGIDGAHTARWLRKNVKSK